MPRRRRGNKLPKPRPCTCEKCRSQCDYPGWFAYGEAERVARFLGTSLEQLFLTKLCAIRYVPKMHRGPERTDEVWCLVPATTDVEPGDVMPLVREITSITRYNGCVFFDEEKKLCTIHQVKPYVCRHSWHWDIEDSPNPSITYRAVVSWATPFAQEQIADLLVASRTKASSLYIPKGIGEVKVQS